MWNLIIFAALGMLIGAASRLMYPNRQMSHVLGSLALGAAGGIAGGMISWAFWPEVIDQFQSGNLVVSAIGALLVIVGWAGISYLRKIGGRQGVAS